LLLIIISVLATLSRESASLLSEILKNWSF
jgi:hypothetical protein